MPEAFQLSPRLRQMATVLRPKAAQQPILPPEVRSVVHQWLTEINAAEDLRKVGVAPRRSALLSGPPGCGKTTLAHHLAARLGIALLCVHADRLRSQYIGQTGQQIAALFEDLTGQEDRCILFLDEFDAIATKRVAVAQSSDREANAIVDSLLQRVEMFGGTFVAATNRAADIDPAMWRRFGLHLEIPLPGEDERFAILTRYLEPFRLAEEAMEFLCAATAGAAPSLLQQLMEGIKRDLVLSPRLRRETGALAVLSRALVSVKPHPDYSTPPLWEDHQTRSQIAGLPWPPTLPGAERAA